MLIPQKELTELEQATGRLYEAVEKGFLPMDGSLQERAQKLNARREAILIDMTGPSQDRSVALDKINAS